MDTEDIKKLNNKIKSEYTTSRSLEEFIKWIEDYELHVLTVDRKDICYYKYIKYFSEEALPIYTFLRKQCKLNNIKSISLTGDDNNKNDAELKNDDYQSTIYLEVTTNQNGKQERNASKHLNEFGYVNNLESNNELEEALKQGCPTLNYGNQENRVFKLATRTLEQIRNKIEKNYREAKETILIVDIHIRSNQEKCFEEICDLVENPQKLKDPLYYNGLSPPPQESDLEPIKLNVFKGIYLVAKIFNLCFLKRLQ